MYFKDNIIKELLEEKVLDKEVVIHCKSVSEIDSLVKLIQEDKKWIIWWSEFGRKTCYKFSKEGIVSYSPIDHYYSQGYEILNCSQFLENYVLRKEVKRVKEGK